MYGFYPLNIEYSKGLETVLGYYYFILYYYFFLSAIGCPTANSGPFSSGHLHSTDVKGTLMEI